MTGWRVGYCAGPEAIIRAMLLVLQQSSRGPATFVQDAAAVCPVVGSGLRAPDGGRVPGPARPGRRAAARHPGRRAARPRGGPVRDGGRPRAGQAVRGRPPVPAARRGRRRDPRLGLRAGRRGHACASRSRPAARRSSAASIGSARGCCDWRPKTAGRDPTDEPRPNCP